jgi:hypothetical protein
MLPARSFGQTRYPRGENFGDVLPVHVLLPVIDVQLATKSELPAAHSRGASHGWAAAVHTQ